MIGFYSAKNRFSLYYLEESEVYLQDLSAMVSFYDFTLNEEKKERGKIHVCSKTLIFEPERQELPLQKYFYKQVVNKQMKCDTNSVFFTLKRIIEINTQGPPSPYIYHEDIQKKIIIQPLYEQNSVVFQLLDRIQKINNESQDIENEVTRLILEKQTKLKFNMSFIESVSEKPLIQKELFVRLIMPLIQTQGLLFITNSTVYFQPMYKVSAKPVKKIQLEKIQNLYKRRYELREIGLELIVENKSKTYYFAFNTTEEMEEVYKALVSKINQDLINEVLKTISMEKTTYLWQSGQISNFEYLLRLNQAGNRSFSDLTQYPVFPQVIVDYNSATLDLKDPSIYRDLRKPIGAINAKRLDEFKKRYKEMPNPKFLYGTHYSTPGYVIGYLVRQKPQYMLKLQSGKFDKPDRLFKSIKGDWRNVMNNPTSLKELIPEFFMDDDSFLQNKLNLDLGIRQNGKKVNDVKLPKWAKNAKQFLQITREALESDYVSNELHNWIDLIFGYKQKGPSSIEADNVFHYLTYEGTVSLSSLNDPMERAAIRCQINEFGQCPKQIFKIPHPPKYAALRTSQTLYKNPSLQTDGNQVVEEEKDAKISHQKSFHQMDVEGILWESLEKKNDMVQKTIPKAHKSNITDCQLLTRGNENMLVTVGQDGFLKVVDIKEAQVMKSFKICDFCLSTLVSIKQDEIFAIGSWDSKVHLFNINYGSKVQVVDRFNDAVSALVFLKKKKLLITGSWDCSLKAFQCTDTTIDESSEETIQDYDAQITSVACSDDEKLLAVGDVDGRAFIMGTESWDQRGRFELTGEKVVKVQFFRSNLLVAGDSALKLFDIIGGNLLTTFKVDKFNGQITDFLIDRDKYLIACTKKGHISLFSMLIETKLGYLYTDFDQQHDLLPFPDHQFTKMALKNDSRTLILTSANGSINLLANVQ